MLCARAASALGSMPPRGWYLPTRSDRTGRNWTWSSVGRVLPGNGAAGAPNSPAPDAPLDAGEVGDAVAPSLRAAAAADADPGVETGARVVLGAGTGAGVGAAAGADAGAATKRSTGPRCAEVLGGAAVLLCCGGAMGTGIKFPRPRPKREGTVLARSDVSLAMRVSGAPCYGCVSATWMFHVEHR